MAGAATAGLVAGGAVCATGAVCVARARRRRDPPLAALPLPFGRVLRGPQPPPTGRAAG